MTRLNFEESELPRRRAIAAAVLIDADIVDYLPQIYLFLGQLPHQARHALADYLRLRFADDMLRDRARIFAEVRQYIELAMTPAAQRKRRGIITRLCLWGWTPYGSSAPTDYQRERAREADSRPVELAL